MTVNDLRPSFTQMTVQQQLDVILAVRSNRRISKRAIKQQDKSFDKEMNKVVKMKPTDIMSLLSQLMEG